MDRNTGFLARFVPGLYAEAVWSVRAGLTCRLLLHPPLMSALSCRHQPDAAPLLPHFRAFGQGLPWPLTLGVIADKRTEGPFWTASFFKAPPPPPRTSMEIQSAAAFSDAPPRAPLPGGYIRFHLQTLQRKRKAKGMVICISFEYCLKQSAPSQACSRCQSPRCPSGPHPHWLGFTVPVF